MLLSPPRRYRHENAELWDLLLRSQRRIAEIKLKPPPPPPTPPDEDSTFTESSNKEDDELSLASEISSIVESSSEWTNEKLDFEKVTSSAETVKNFLGINNNNKENSDDKEEDKDNSKTNNRDFDQERREILALLQLCKRRLEYDFQTPGVEAVSDSDSVTVTTDTSFSTTSSSSSYSSGSGYSSRSGRSKRRGKRRQKQKIRYIPDHEIQQQLINAKPVVDIYLDRKLARAILYLCKATQGLMVSAVETVADDIKEETKELIVGIENNKIRDEFPPEDDIPCMGEEENNTREEQSVKYLWDATQNVLSNAVSTATEELHLQTVPEEFRSCKKPTNGNNTTNDNTPTTTAQEIEDIPYLEDDNILHLWDATRNFMSDAVKTAAKEFNLQTM